MNHSRTLNNKINKIHERSLRVVYDDKKATFKELLDNDKAVSIHPRNLQILVTEMFKVKISESPSIMHEIFQTDDSNNLNLRKNSRFKLGNPNTVYYGTKTISGLGPTFYLASIRAQQVWKDFKVRLRIGCI